MIVARFVSTLTTLMNKFDQKCSKADEVDFCAIKIGSLVLKLFICQVSNYSILFFSPPSFRNAIFLSYLYPYCFMKLNATTSKTSPCSHTNLIKGRQKVYETMQSLLRTYRRAFNAGSRQYSSGT